MTLATVMINDTDLRELGFIVERCEGWRDVTAREYPAIDIPGLAGQLVTSGSPVTEMREILVEGFVRGTTVAECVALYTALLGRLNGLLEISTIDNPTVFVWARLAGALGPPLPPQFIQSHHQMRLRFVAADPRRYQKQLSIRGFGQLPRAMLLGAAPSAPIIEIAGAVTNPVLIYRNTQGAIVKQMSFTAVLAATDYLSIDCQNRLISRYNSGVATTGSAAGMNLMDPTSDFISLDPTDGDALNGVYPTLELSAGAGTSRYRKAWP